MVTIKFPDRKTQDEAVGFLAGSFSGRLLRTGEVIVPEEALTALANENFSFTVIGKTTYEEMVRFRGDVGPKARPGKNLRNVGKPN